MDIRIEYSWGSLYDSCGPEELAAIDAEASYIAYGNLVHEQLRYNYPGVDIVVERGNNDVCCVNGETDHPERPWVDQIMADAYESQCWVIETEGM